MRFALSLFLCLGLPPLLACGSSKSPSPEPAAGPTPRSAAESLHPLMQGALDAVKGKYRFTEGPAADGEANVWFTDIPKQRVYRLDLKSGKAELRREQSGGANGLAFGPDGLLYMCEEKSRQVTKLTSDGNVEVVAARYQGRKLNGPNDLCFDNAGGFYFSDPAYGAKHKDIQQDLEAVYYLAAGADEPVRVISDRQRPNGLLMNPERSQLFVSDAKAGSITVYPVDGPGQLGTGRTLVRGLSKPDGMTLDTDGRLYVATKTGVAVFDASGKALGVIKTPKQPTNVAFAGPGLKTLVVTARRAMYRAPMKTNGVSPRPK